MQKEGELLIPYIFVETRLVPGCVPDTRNMTMETERDVDHEQSTSAGTLGEEALVGPLSYSSWLSCRGT